MAKTTMSAWSKSDKRSKPEQNDGDKRSSYRLDNARRVQMASTVDHVLVDLQNTLHSQTLIFSILEAKQTLQIVTQQYQKWFIVLTQ